MEIFTWIGQNWFEAVQSAGIFIGLIFSATTAREDAKARRIGNLLAVTAEHRDIWKDVALRPELSRVLELTADLTHTPITTAEEVFVKELILHLFTVYRAIEDGLYPRPEGLHRDIRTFFSFPVANAGWEKWKPFQDNDFVRFIESSVSERHPD